MSHQVAARKLLAQEAKALITRIERLSPFALKTPMVTAAAISPAAQTGVESLLLKARRELRGMVERFLSWLLDRAQPPRAAVEAQRRFNVLRLRFNGIIRQFDVFASVLTQRSEHETGVWVAGLDDVAADALHLPGDYFRAPPVICYLDRNHGAAIRRAFTRLPGGGENPVAVISVPRERMIGSGIASSLVHEAGHQGAALLKLVPSLRSALRVKQNEDPEYRQAWTWFDKWISEIVADFWSVARIGIGSTQGLMAVVSLPRPMVFRLTTDDPHPIPWLRVKISCAIGEALYPHPQWRKLAAVWETLYPRDGAPAAVLAAIEQCEAILPEFVQLLAQHRPTTLKGQTLSNVLTLDGMQPLALQREYARWRTRPELTRVVTPCRVFAVIGQARADGLLSPDLEGRALSRLLTYWALKSSLDTSADCAPLLRSRVTSHYAALI
jgi:hypothetical protein